MSSEQLGAAQNVLKGNLGGAWDITNGYQDAYTDLGIARRFGGAAAAYSLRDIGAMNGRVVKVRRDLAGEEADAEEDFSASQVDSGALENWVNGKLENALPTDVNYVVGLEDARYFNGTNSGVVTSSINGLVTATGSIETSFALYAKNSAIVSFEDNSDTNDNLTVQTDSNGVLTLIHRTNGSTNILAKHTQVLDDGKLHTVRWNMTASGSQVILDGNDITSAVTFTTGSVSTVKWVSDLNAPDVLSIGYRAESSPDSFSTGVVVNTKIFGTNINTPLANYLGYGATPWVDTIGSLDGTESNITQTWNQAVGAAAAFSLRKVKADYSGNAVRIRRSSDDVEVNVAFDSDDKVSASSAITNIAEQGGESGQTTATDLNGFLNANEQTVGSAANGTGSVDFNSFSGNSNTGFTVTNSDAGTFKQAVFPYGSGEGDVIVANFDLNITSGSPTIQVRTGAAIGTLTAKSDDATVSSSTNHTITLTCTGDGLYVKFLESDACTFTVSNFSIVSHTQGAFVHTWYDQAGTNDAVQATSANQPKIAESGALLADGIDFDGTNDELRTSTNIASSQPVTVMSVTKPDAVNKRIFESITNTVRAFYGSSSETGLNAGASLLGSANGFSINNEYLQTHLFNTTSSKVFLNATESASGNGGSDAFAGNFSIGGSSALYDGTIKEVIIYTSDQSNNRFRIESNINNYYGLYNDANDLSTNWTENTTDPFDSSTFSANGKDGFTATHTSSGGSDFARADITLNIPLPQDELIYFSFNFKLNSGSMGHTLGGKQSDGTTNTFGANAAIEEGFNTVNVAPSNGTTVKIQIATATTSSFTISDFKVSRIERNGFVPTWYDQSGNSDDAVQATAGSQPKIVLNGGIVRLNNGKPAIIGDGTDDFLQAGYFYSAGDVDAMSTFSVCSSNVDTVARRVIISAGSGFNSTYKGMSLYLDKDTNGNALAQRVRDDDAGTTTTRTGVAQGGNILAFSFYTKDSTHLVKAITTASGELSQESSISNGAFRSGDTSGALRIGADRTFQNDNFFNLPIAETMVFKSDLRNEGIEDIINQFYNI